MESCMQKAILSFEIIDPSEALIEQIKTILQSFKQINNISLIEEKVFLNEFRDSIKEVKRLRKGDNSMLYSGSLDDMLSELK